MKLYLWLVACLPYAAAAGLSVWALPHLPQQLPTHWGPSGNPDAWGSPAQALFLPLALMLPASLLTLAVAQFSPKNRHNAPFLFLVSLGLGLLALVQTAQVIFDWDSVKTSLTSLGGLFLLIGNGMGKLKPSKVAGLRTPWVYRSRRAWHSSQRRAGLWFTLYGLMLGLAPVAVPREGLVPLFYPLGIALGPLLLMPVLVYASYLDYKNDPDPQPVGS